MDRIRKKEHRQVRFAEEVEIFYVNEDHSSTWSATIPVARENRERRALFGRTRIDGPYYTTLPANEQPLENLELEGRRGSLLHLELNMVPFVSLTTQAITCGFGSHSSHHPRTISLNMGREQCSHTPYTYPIFSRIAEHVHESMPESVTSASSNCDPSIDNEHFGSQSLVTTSIQNGNPVIPQHLPSPEEVPIPTGSRLKK